MTQLVCLLNFCAYGMYIAGHDSMGCTQSPIKCSIFLHQLVCLEGYHTVNYVLHGTGHTKICMEALLTYTPIRHASCRHSERTKACRTLQYVRNIVCSGGTVHVIYEPYVTHASTHTSMPATPVDSSTCEPSQHRACKCMCRSTHAKRRMPYITQRWSKDSPHQDGPNRPPVAGCGLRPAEHRQHMLASRPCAADT